MPTSLFERPWAFENSCLLFGQTGLGAKLKSSIQDYKPFQKNCGEIKLIRKLKIEEKNYYLAVDHQNLSTQIVSEQCLACLNQNISEPWSSALNVLVERTTSAPFPLANDGLNSFENSGIGQVVSIDLCPSRKRFDQVVVEELIQKSPIIPVPVTFALTTSWMQSFPRELEYIKDQIKNRRLDVTWMNHSWTHPYRPGISLEQNFLLSANVDKNKEILGAEKSFIENGIIPSIFYRFPGLISNEQWILKLRELNLVPVGSLAWLGKNERVNMRSLILIHGNGNEPKGIEKMLDLLNQRKVFPRSLESYSLFGM